MQRSNELPFPDETQGDHSNRADRWGADNGSADISDCVSDEECAAGNVAAAPCTAWACDPADGCIEVPVTGVDCDDADLCTVDDQCLAGACVGQPVNCDDQDPCTEDACDPATGCINAIPDDGSCDDLDACTKEDLCVDGTCIGIAIDCEDGDPCTDNACNVASGCAFSPLTGNPCDDSDPCTTNDTCVDGHCSGDSINCEDGNPCTVDYCGADGACLHAPGTGALCNDGNACTDLDQCVEGLCLGQASKCDDGNPCTLDSCNSQGGCIHTEPPGLPCDDGNECTTNDQCYQGGCVGGSALACDDGSQCTDDSCAPDSGCVFEPLGVIPCDDSDACTESDTCNAGLCAGVAVVCQDASSCTADSCDPATGCVFAPMDGPCDDGDPCTAGDFCSGGLCQPGPDPECLAIERIVLAGDSWSTGLIIPFREALDDRGYEEVILSWELTSKPGSKLAGWLADDNMMNALYLSLDVDPPAELLVFTLSGNDYLGACKNGLGLTGPLGWLAFMTQVQSDLQTFIGLARMGRPHLKVMLIGYDYLHFEMIQALGNTMPGLNTVTFNLGLIELATRGRDAALAMPDTIYAHSMGLCQHTFGDYFHPPFLCPNPVAGCPEYGPGQAPKPGPAPGYNPFPGGWYTYPGPLDHVPDGIHLDPAGYRAIADNALDQGGAAWIEGQ